MSKTKPWTIKEGVYEHVVLNPHTQKIDDIRKKGLETPSKEV